MKADTLRQKFVSLNDALSLALQLGEVPEQVARERLWRAVANRHVPLLVSTSPGGPWRSPTEHEIPRSGDDVDFESSGYVCHNIMVMEGSGIPPSGMYFEEIFLFARVSWPAFMEDYFSVETYPRAPKQRGGRPPAYNWAAFEREAGRWIYHNGFPKPQRLLVDYMAQWCLWAWGDEPANSVIRERVKSIVGYYAQAPSAGN